MSYLNLKELREAVEIHKSFQHQIKGKRIKKQLQNLMQYHNELLKFEKYQISPYGNIEIQVATADKFFNFQILLDDEYPFNKPQILYINQKSILGNGQNLLINILERKEWGPSMLIRSVFDKLPTVAELILNQNQDIQTQYQINQLYCSTFLTKFKIQTFVVEEYIWKYKVIKSTQNKVLGLTRQYLLLFLQQGQKLRLQRSIKLRDIHKTNGNIRKNKLKLDIDLGNQILYLGSKQQHFQSILNYLNPIQYLQQKISKLNKQNKSVLQKKQLIILYSELVQHYDLKDQQKMKKSIKIIQELIKEAYDQEIPKQIKFQNVANHDIKT